MEGNALAHKTCIGCGKPLTDDSWYPSSRSKGVYRCISCCKEQNVINLNRDARLSLFRKKRNRCRHYGVEFTLTYGDIEFPDLCPVLGIPLDYSYGSKGNSGRNSPSFDRIDPNKGYMQGNVIIISQLANQIKTNATVDEIERVAAFYRQMIPQAGASHV